MIPILFEKNETTFTTNGLGRLTDCISCLVTEERNGIYTCEFTYPVSGMMFDEIQKGRIIACTHDESGDIQPFDIYASTEPINGVVTFFASHISYRLNEITCAPFTAVSATTALSGLVSNSYTTNDFTMTTDIVSSTPFNLAAPTPVRSALGGIEGSMLDTYGGEYEFDKFSVILQASRGTLKDYEVRYGKNLTEYEDNIDYSETYNGVVPYWKGVDEESNEISVIGTVTMSGQSHYSGRDVVVPMDLSGEFDDVPTAAELESMALAIMTNNQPWLPNRNITVTAIPQWQSEEYFLYEHIGLCDTIKVVFPLYNMSGTMKIVKTVHNVLLDKYDSFELGRLQTTLAQAINNSIEPKIEEAEAVGSQALKIAGNSAQHFWFKPTGGDTGAHIAEVDRDTFETTPQGGNLLARSNGIAVRDGLDELALFGSTGMRIGKTDEKHIAVTNKEFTVYEEDGSTPFLISTSDSASTSGVVGSVAVNANSTLSGTYLYINGVVVDNKIYFDVGTTVPTPTSTTYADVSTSTSLTLDGVNISIYKLEADTFFISYENTTNVRRYVVFNYKEHGYITTVRVNDALLKPTYEKAMIVDSTGTSKQEACNMHSYGHVTTLSMDVYNTTSISVGGLIYAGRLLNHLPASIVKLTGYLGSQPVMGTLSTIGEIYIYNTGRSSFSSSSSSPISLSATYITEK